MGCNWNPYPVPPNVKGLKDLTKYLKTEVDKAAELGVHPSSVMMDKLSVEDAVKAGLENSYVLYDMMRNGANAEAILDRIEESSYNSKFKTLASTLKTQAKQLNDLKFGFMESGGEFVGRYIPSQRAIDVSSDLKGWTLERVLMHEMLHDLLTGLQKTDPKSLNKKQKEFVDGVKSLYNTAKKRGVKGYGMTSEFEFIIEAMSNPTFQKDLDSKLIEPRTSFWDKLVQKIAEMLGYDKHPRTLGDLINLTNDVITGNNVYKHDGKLKMGALHATGEGYRDEFVTVKTVDDFASKLVGSEINYDESSNLDKTINNTLSQNREYRFRGIVISPKDSESDVRTKTEKIRKEMKKSGDRGVTFSNWINEGANIDSDTFKLDKDNVIHEKSTLDKFKRLINLKPNQTYHLLKDANKLGIKFDDSILPKNSDNYMISVTETDGIKRVQVYSFLPHGESHLLGLNTRIKNLLGKFFKPGEIKRFNVDNFLNNKRGVQKLNTLMIANNISANNSNVILDSVGTVKMGKNDVSINPVMASDFKEMFDLFKEKHSDVYDELPEAIQRSLNSPESNKIDYQLKDYVNFLNNLNESYLSDSSDPKAYMNIAQITKDKIDSFVKGEATNKELREVLNSRLKYINKLQKRIGEDSLAIDTEKKALSKAIFETDKLLKGSWKSLSIDEGKMGLFKNIFDIRNSALQYAKSQFFNAQDVAVRKTKRETAEIGKLIDAIRVEKRITSASLTKDNHEAIFGGLFVEEKVLDVDGKERVIRGRRLKFGEEQKGLSNNEKELISKLNDKIKENFINQKVHEYQEDFNFYENGKFQEEKALETASSYFNEVTYGRTIMPVTYQSTQEKVMQKRFKDAFVHEMKTINNDGTLEENFVYTEDGVKDANDVSMSDMRVKNMFDSQQSEENVYKAMGIAVNQDGQRVLVDEDMYNNTSIDLESMILKHTHHANRKIELEKTAIPAYLTAKSLLKNYSNTDSNHKVLDELKRRYVDNKRADFADWEKSLNKYVRPMTSLLTKTGIAFNPNTITSAYLMNKFGKIRVKLANDVSWFASYENLTKANVWVAKNYKKAEAIARNINQLQETEDDLLNTHFYKVAAKFLGSNEYMYGALRKIDETLRVQVAIAQLMQDGALEAYEDDGTYNPNKDPRWKGEDGKVAKEALVEQQKMEGLIESDSTEPIEAYSFSSMRAIKNVVGKYIIGGMSSREVPLIFDSFIGQNLAVFKRHIPTLLGKAFNKDVATDSFSFLKGDQIMTHNFMGQWTAIARTLKERDLRKEKGLKEYINTMPDAQKNALKQAGTSAALWGVMLGALATMAAFGLDDEDEHYYTSWFMKRMNFVKNDTIGSLLVLNMSEEIFSTPFILDKATALYDGQISRVFTSNSFGAWYDMFTEGGSEK